MNGSLMDLLERIAVAQESQAQSLEKVADRLDLLIQAMGEPEDPDAPARTYMDGSPCL